MRFFFLLLISLYGFSCELKKEVVSLSYPITTMLDQLGLLNSKKLKAISSLHYTKSSYDGVKLAGGIFLAKNSINQYQNQTIFYDTSIDLKNMFAKISNINSVEVKTRDLDPFATYAEIIKLLEPYLDSCETKISEINLKVSDVKKSYSLVKNKEKIIFFMGKCLDGKWPNTVIANDGFVKFLRDEQIIETYPSDTAYVIWSKKIMNDLKKFKKFCIDTSQAEFKLSRNKLIYNINSPYAFNPGYSQIEFLEQLLTILKQ